MKHVRLALILLVLLLMAATAFSEEAKPEVLPPAYPVREDVATLLSIAQAEVGYEEQRDGSTKYGQWAGDAKAEWCAEFLCWSVDQADQALGTQMLNQLYPNYSANNTGRDWFIRQGRYIARRGIVPGWGSQWYLGEETAMARNSYVPQPGDWVFFSYNSTGDTSHVAMVEHSLKLPDGSLAIQVIEGNNPSGVFRAQYALDDWRIQGYGTVRDLADLVLRMGVEGEKVRTLQAMMADMGLLAPTDITAFYNQRTSDALKVFQHQQGLRQTGLANQETQLKLQAEHLRLRMETPGFWQVQGNQ